MMAENAPEALMVRYLPELVKAISEPSTLACGLLSRKIISRTVYKDAIGYKSGISKQDKSVSICDAVLQSVHVTPSHLVGFVEEACQDSPAVNALCDEIKKDPVYASLSVHPQPLPKPPSVHPQPPPSVHPQPPPSVHPQPPPSVHPQPPPKPPSVHPQPLPKPANAHKDQLQGQTECDAPSFEEDQEEEQLGEQGNYYPMDSSPHGRAVIFNFVGERNTPKHFPEGASNSVGKFVDTFKNLGYTVHPYQFLSGEEMKTSLTESIKKEHDSFVCCIMAHGENGSIVAKDGDVKIRDLQKEVGENCPNLRGKPKIFIVQACRGNDVDESMEASEEDKAEDEEEDEALSPQLSREADFYIAYSTTEGHVSPMNKTVGCHYLNKLCDIFKERAAHLTLDEMVMEVHRTLGVVSRKVRNKGRHVQMGQVVHTLRGPVRFKKT